MPKITRMSDHQAKHRRVPSSLPLVNFPDGDPISEPSPTPMSSLVSSARSSGFTPEELEECGFRVLPAAMRSPWFRHYLKVVPA